MNTIEWTLIIMQDWEEIFVEFTKDQINKAIDEALSCKRNYITINKLNRDIYFNYIKDKRAKTRYIALPEPKVKCEMTREERAEYKRKEKQILADTYEGRKKRFLARRQETLKQLEKEEKYFDLETTIFKLNDYNKVKNELLLLNNK